MIDPASRLSHDSLAIFLFHGVVPSNGDYKIRNYTRKHLTADRFRSLIGELASQGAALSMDAVVDHIDRGAAFPPNAFAITFDDGFANNLTVAGPILESADIPATFYVTTGFVEANGMSWIDRIEVAFEQTEESSVDLPWSTDPVALGSAEERIQALELIRAHVKSGALEDVEGFVEHIFHATKVDSVVSSPDMLDQKLTWEQVSQMNEHPLFTVGGHSHTHAVLSFLSRPRLEHEVATSLRLLRERAGVFTSHYSYPEGLEHCYSDEVIFVLRQHGIRCCPTAIDGVNPVDTDLFHLRRIAVI